MRKAYKIIILAVVVLIFGLFISRSYDAARGASNVTIENLIDRFGDRVFKCLYSLEETRPYSIIQLDKTAELYDNKWLPPANMVTLLDKKDKAILKNKIETFISGKPSIEGKPAVEANALVGKIRYWCFADIQLELLSESMHLSRDDLLNAIGTIESTKSLTAGTGIVGIKHIATLSEIDKDKIYCLSLNYISSLTVKGQLGYYSELFARLSRSAEK